MGYLIGEVLQPDPEDATYNAWDVENSIAMSWLINSMEPKIGRTYLFYKTTSEVWEAVKNLYLDMENMTQCFEVD